MIDRKCFRNGVALATNEMIFGQRIAREMQQLHEINLPILGWCEEASHGTFTAGQQLRNGEHWGGVSMKDHGWKTQCRGSLKLTIGKEKVQR